MLAKTVLALVEPYRTTVLLRYFEGLSSAEIARRTGVPSATVRWRLMRALEELRGKLDARHGGDRRSWCVVLAPLCRTASVSSAAAAIPFALWIATGAPALAALAWGARAWKAREAGEPARLGAEPAHEVDDARSATSVRGSRADGDDRELVGVTEAHRASLAANNASAEVHVRAVDAAGDLVRDARLRAVAGTEQGHAAQQGPSTTAEGRVVLVFRPRDPQGDAPCELELSAPGRVPRMLRARVRAGASVDLGSIELAEAGAVVGRVLGADGRGLGDARVKVELLPSRWLDIAAVPLEEARHRHPLLDASVPTAECAPDGSYRFGGPARGLRAPVGERARAGDRMVGARGGARRAHDGGSESRTRRPRRTRAHRRPGARPGGRADPVRGGRGRAALAARHVLPRRAGRGARERR